MKTVVKKLFNLFDLEINRLNVVSAPAYQTAQTLKAHRINVVFDVGANTGQFAIELRMHGYKGKIISFEPLAQAHKAITKRAEQDSNWVVHSRCAVGAKLDQIEINVSANSVSSSILPMLSAHENAAPDSKYTHKELVPLVTLDSVYEQYCMQGDNVFLKVDTQGYESEVLDGASLFLGKCQGVLLELSLVPLYEGSSLWQEVISRMERGGLLVWALQPGFTDASNGRTLQVDGVFFRE